MKRRPVSYRPNTARKPFSAHRAEKKAHNKLLVTILLIIFFGYAFINWILPGIVGGLYLLNHARGTQTPAESVADNAVLAPPVLNIPYEATNSAAIKIKGYSTPNSSVELYVDNDLKDTASTQEDGSFVSDDINLNVGTNNIYGQTVDSQGNKSLPSKTIRLSYISEKPKLEINEPSDNKTITGGDKKVQVSGTTDQSDRLSVTINGTRVIVNSDGNFSRTVDINEGENTITITATDIAGNSTQVTRKVIYQP